MHKILLILQREYLSRVKKKSFIIMTFLGPLLMVGIGFASFYVGMYGSDAVYKIMVVDQHPDIFITKLPRTEQLLFKNTHLTLDSAKKNFDPEEYYGILYIPADIVKNPGGISLFTEKQASLTVTAGIEDLFEKRIEEDKLKAAGIDQELLASTKTKVDLKTLTLKGEESSAGLASAVGMISGFLMYFFIFLYGAQVMRGVIEEKANRIVEVMISSVRPFQLMMGKILGIALVGLTQFLLWIILTTTLFAAGSSVFIEDEVLKTNRPVPVSEGRIDNEALQGLGSQPQFAENETADIVEKLDLINFPLIISCFIFFFLGGYLLYSALYAAVGSAVDNETETQQFMVPLTLPLVLAFIVAQNVMKAPDSQLAFWFSIIPFTSPVVMMARIAFGVPAWELALSMLLLLGGFVFTTWVAGKIYRTGILMYGKKITYKELSRWLFYKG